MPCKGKGYGKKKAPKKGNCNTPDGQKLKG